MHRGLPLLVSIESISFSPSESGFGTSVNSATLVGLHAVHSWTSGSRLIFVIFHNIDLNFKSVLIWFLDELVCSVDY